MKKNKCTEKNPRLGRVGGQAVLEGVMMKAGDHTVTSCRKEDGSIVVCDSSFTSVRKKHKFLNLPLLRGVINFVEMMKLSVSTLEASAEALGIEEEESKFEKWLQKHFGKSVVNLVMILGVVLGLALSVTLFLFLPRLIVNDLLNGLILDGKMNEVLIAALEGSVKVLIFLAYLLLVSLIPDIRRTFMYHGSEHKSIACYEAGMELTPENAMKCTRFHPRCGTSFMFFMVLIGVVVGIFVNLILPGLGKWAYTGIRLLLLPLVVGIGYEIIMFAGKHDNLFTRILSAPGLWVQRITTREPTPDMLEIAITSLKCAMRDEEPAFMDFYLARPWEKKPAEETPADEASGDTPADSADDKEPDNAPADSAEADAPASPEPAADAAPVTAPEEKPFTPSDSGETVAPVSDTTGTPAAFSAQETAVSSVSERDASDAGKTTSSAGECAGV